MKKQTNKHIKKLVCELAGICELVGARRFVELCTVAYNNKKGWVGA